MIPELARESYLKPNGLGGYIISASALMSWGRCQLEKFYDDRARRDPDAPQGEHLASAAYGNVVHYALMVGMQAENAGTEDGRALALKTFEYYWQPENLSLLGLKITKWLPRETFGGFRERGLMAIRDYFEMQSKDESWLLALEYAFAVPLEVDGRTHTLHGFIDRLELAKYYRKPYVRPVDFKTGKKHPRLRHNLQGTFYSFVTTQPEFWFGWENSGLEGLEHFDARTIGRLEKSLSSWGYALHSGSPAHREQGMPLASRRFRWVDLKDIKFSDGGWRNERDYARLGMAVDAYVRAREAGIYSPNISGETCTYCAFAGICGGIGLPHEDEGKP